MNLVRLDRIASAALATAILLAAEAANAQPAHLSQVQIKTTDLGRMTYMLQGGRGDNKTPPAPAGALPNETYVGGSSTVAVGGSTALLTHINNADINNADISRTPMC